jgi:hypothetical protein
MANCSFVTLLCNISRKNSAQVTHWFSSHQSRIQRLSSEYASQTCKTICARSRQEGKVSTKQIPMLSLRLPSDWLRGTDLAPPGGIHGTSISNESIPKSAVRVLDAARIRAEYRQKRARLQTDEADVHGGMSASKLPPSKKRRTNAGPTEAEKSGNILAKGKDHPTSTIEIQSGESLKHFNRYAFFAPLNPSTLKIECCFSQL